MMTIEEAKRILAELFNREMNTYIEDASLGISELVALQVMADYIRYLEEKANG